MTRLSALAALLVAAPFAAAPLAAQTAAVAPVDAVDPMIGTSNSRWMLFPGPSMPFGMVKLSPDNQGSVWEGGYEYTVNSISGFSFLHDWSTAGLSLMPTTGPLVLHAGPPDGPFQGWTAGYRSRIRKETERASAGYYAVRLEDAGVDVEVTATTHAGILRLVYPNDRREARLLLDFDFPIEGKMELRGAAVRRVSDHELEGSLTYHADWSEDYTLHFVMRLSRPLERFGGWTTPAYTGTDDTFGTDWRTERDVTPDTTAFACAGDCGTFVEFGPNPGTVTVETAISFVSVDGARRNFAAEVAPLDGDFDAAVRHARSVWGDLLGRADVQGGTERDRRLFYTSLYRAYVARSILSDADGQYVDACEQTRTIAAPGDAMYGSDAFWGAQWNLFPLWTLLTPRVALSWSNSLLEFNRTGGWLPKGTPGLEYAAVMVGEHENTLLASAVQKGLNIGPGGFDAEEAYRAIRHVLTTPGVMPHPCGGEAGGRDRADYLALGYVPEEAGPASNTMAYAYDDAVASELARRLGHTADADTFAHRAMNYKNIFDPETGFVRRKTRAGAWAVPLDSTGFSGTWFGPGYVEGSAWQYTFHVPHDVAGVVRQLGRERFIRRLEQGFALGFVDIGNQPNMQAPYLFTFAGAPWLTQTYARQLLQTEFDATPYVGWHGEEDQGQMGAWFTLSALGLFEMDGGTAERPVVVIGSPLFERATLRLEAPYYAGGTFTIEAPGNSPENVYVQSATLDGRPLDRAWLYHDEITAGGTLRLVMGPAPSRWGADLPPPSFSTLHPSR